MEFLQDAQIWVLSSFLIFCFIIWKFAKDKVLGLLDKRIEDIRKEIETAESLRVEAQELLAQYQRKQRDAASEARVIIATAEKHAAQILADSETELAEIALRREQQLAARLKRMEQNAIQEIHAYAADLAIKATSEIITRQMDKKTNENLIQNSIKTIAGHLG